MMSNMAQGEVQAPEAIIFDWDNTLIDSWPCIHRAINETMIAMSMPEWSLAETKAKVGLSMRDAFPTLFGERWEEARDVFYAAFRSVHLEMLTPYEGAERLLRGLSEDSTCLSSVVSNKTGAFLREEADALTWASHFLRLVGAGDAARDKPAPDPVLMAFEPAPERVTSIIASGEPNHRLWCVGDSWVDLALGHAVGAFPVLLRPEPPAVDEFLDCRPGLWVPDCDGLYAVLAETGLFKK